MACTTIEVTAIDLAGNTSTAKRTITFDDENPLLAVTNPPQDVKTNQANMTIVGETSDITAVTVTITMDGNTYTPTVTNGLFEQSVTFTDEKTYQVLVTAINEVGNQTIVQRNIVYDITPPSVTLDPVTSPTNQDAQILNGTVEAGATVNVICPSAIVGTVTYPTSTTWTATVSDMVEGDNGISVTATDDVGNTSQPVTASITVDLTPPVITVSSPAPGSSHNSTIDIGATVTDTISGVSSVEYQMDSGLWTSLALSDPATGSYAATWTPRLADNGNHTVSFRATDKAGNTSGPASVTFLVQMDTIPPVTTITIGTPQYTTNGRVFVTYGTLFTLSATDNLSGVAKTEYRIDGGTWTMYAPFTMASEGSHVIEYRSTDVAGNVETANAQNIVVDNTPPVGGLTINSGTAYTNNGSITLTLTASDTSSGVAKMCISNVASCSSWEAYSETKPWALPSGDGTKTVYVWYQDNVGNSNTAPYSASIGLDLTPPSSAIASPAGGPIMATTLQIIGTASDVGSGVSKVEVSTDGGSTWNVAAATTSWSYQWSVPADGTYTIRSRATDNAGNVEMPGAGITATVYKRQPEIVAINGQQLLMNGNPFVMKGVVYSPVPIGEDPETGPPYGDYFTADYSDIYNRDLPLLRQMGANVLRVPAWDPSADHHDFLDKAYNGGQSPIYIIAGYWIDPGLDIDPQSPANVREELKTDFRTMVAAHKNHPAILMWAIGNDLNADTMYGDKSSDLFSLINEMAEAAHEEEGSDYHPVTTALTDSDLISTISSYDASVPSLDVWGANVYRGNTFGTLFNDYRAISTKPLAILEYGIDAFDNQNGDEYENIGTPYQATYAEALWNEIEANSNLCIGGTLMEYSDEWWKGKYSTSPGCPDDNPSFHSTCGQSMIVSPDGYDNKEWWGIMRTKPNSSGPDDMETRVLYYTLQELWAGQIGPARIAVSPNTADFGSVAVGGAPSTMVFTVSNSGGENLSIGAISLSGINAPEFAKTKDNCSGHTLIPSHACTLQMTFLPITAGLKNATLSITSDDPVTPTASVGLNATATASVSGTVTSAQGPLSGVTMTLSGALSATAVTDSTGNYIFAGLLSGSYTVTPGKGGYAFTPASASLNLSANVTAMNFTGQETTALSYSGDAAGDYHDSATLSATLTKSSTGAPVSGETITFALGSQSCSGVTDSTGKGSCTITLAQAPGNYTVMAGFAGDSRFTASNDTKPFAITKEETTLAYTGPSFIAQGMAVNLSAVLKEDGAVEPNPSGQIVNFTIGSGSSSQTCSGTIDAGGLAHCTINLVTLPSGQVAVTAAFNGDSSYQPSADGKSATVFAFLSEGSFVIGDQDAVVGNTVTFWGSQWAKNNSLSGGSAAASFKGFADVTSTSPASCGGTWNTLPGNSSNPPSAIPSYMAVVVSSCIGKSGNTISGNSTKIVIVKTDPGYAPNPGHSGTGTVIGVLCP